MGLRDMDDLCRAAYYGHRDAVEVLLQQKEERRKPDAPSISIPPNESTTDGSPSEFPHDALQAALYSGQQGSEVSKWLLDDIGDVNEEGGHFGNALQAACAGGHVPSVQWLIEQGADVNSKGRYGSALKVACLCGHDDVVRLLLEAGARSGLSHGGHFDAFEAAVSRNQLSTLTLLVNSHPRKISLPKKSTLKGHNPLASALRSACLRGHIDIVRYLLANGVADSAVLALEEAFISGHEDIIEVLLGELKVIPDYVRHEVMNCIVNDVLDLMPPTTPFSRSRTGIKAPSIDDTHEESFLESIIHEPLRESSEIQLQDHYVPDIDVDYPQGKRFIYRLVASRATPNVFERFVSKGMPLDGDGKPSLIEIAALHGNIDVVELLLDKNRPVGSALQCAIKAGREDIVRLILSKRPETAIDKVVDLPSLAEDPQDERNYPRWPEPRRAAESPLSLAMAWGNDAIAEMLLDHGKSAKWSKPSLALVLQALEGNMPNVQKILTQIYGPCLGLGLNEFGLETNALHAARAAAANGHIDVVDMILQSVGPSDLGNIILRRVPLSKNILLGYLKEITYEAAMNDQLELLNLIDEIATSSDREHFSGIKLLAIIHRNTIWGEDARVKEILELHCTPPSELFQTYLNKCLREALEMQNLRVASLLLEQQCLNNFVKNTPDILHTAMNSRYRRRWHGVVSVKESEEFREIIKTLIRIGADVEGIDEHMRSPVYYACLYGLPETFQILLDHGASIAKVYSVTEAGVTEAIGLFRTEQQGSHDEYLSIESVNLLKFTLGCINLKTKAQDTCEKWGRIIFKLINAGIDFEPNDPNLGNILYAFSASGDTAAVEKLFEYGVNPNAPIKPGICEEHFGSALHVAAVTEQVEVLRILISHGADVSAQRTCRQRFKGESEVTPTQAALQWGHESSKWDRFWEVCESLVEAGAGEEDCQDVLQFACEHGNVHLAKRLLDSGTRLSEMPITLSVGILKLMLAHGTAINSPTGRAGELQRQAARMASCEVMEYLVAETGFLVSARKIIAEVFSKRVITPVEEQKRMLEFILRERYIDINGLYRCTCHKNWTNLFQKLIEIRDIGLIELGLAQGADPHCPGCPNTAISLLFKNCSEWYRVEEVISIAEKLLDHGASIDGTKDVAEEDKPDQTPLLFALASSESELVRFLISHGADVNRGVISPLTFAYWNKDRGKRAEFVKLLKSKGAVAKPIGGVDVMALHTGLRNGMPWLPFKYRYECGYAFDSGEDHY
ncbi:ankyrin repeat-containing domain protein [Xylaria venustula]|nr:ankyrin repeat-containing domain protein [Xylaria venustula]